MKKINLASPLCSATTSAIMCAVLCGTCISLIPANLSADVYNPFYPITSTAAASSTAAYSGGVNVYGISSYRVISGQTMSIFGSGFDSSSNSIQIGSSTIQNLPSTQGGTLISFTVPQSVPSGSYPILVFNQFGLGSSGALDVNISATASSTATTTPSLVPVITGITPQSSHFLTQVVIISGSNFTGDNTIETNFGNLTNIPSGDGRNLVFTVGTLPYYEQALGLYKGQTVNISINVINENGTSNQALHTVTFPASGNIADASPATTADILSSTSDYQSYMANNSYNVYVPYVSPSNDLSLLSVFGLSGTPNTSASTDIANSNTSYTNTGTGSGYTYNSLPGLTSGSMNNPMNNQSQTGTSTSNNSSTQTRPVNVTAGGVVNPYITNINPYITGPLINPPASYSIYATAESSAAPQMTYVPYTSTQTMQSAAPINYSSLSGASNMNTSSPASSAPSSINYFGGLVVKTIACTADNTSLVYIRDYAHEYQTYGVTFDPKTANANPNLNLGKNGLINAGTYISGTFTTGGKPCIVNNTATSTNGGYSDQGQLQSLVDVSVGSISSVQMMSTVQ